MDFRVSGGGGVGERRARRDFASFEEGGGGAEICGEVGADLFTFFVGISAGVVFFAFGFGFDADFGHSFLMEGISACTNSKNALLGLPRFACWTETPVSSVYSLSSNNVFSAMQSTTNAD